jgi:hypothetical protein
MMPMIAGNDYWDTRLHGFSVERSEVAGVASLLWCMGQVCFASRSATCSVIKNSDYIVRLHYRTLVS